MQNSIPSHPEQGPSRKTHFLAKIALWLISVVIVVAIVALVRKKNEDDLKSRLSEATHVKAPREVSKGESLQTRFFDVVIDSVAITDSVSDNINMLKLPAQPGVQYLVLSMRFRNTGKESNMVPEGQLRISQENNEMKYVRPETLVKEGWGLLMQNIDPGVIKATRIVYKIPAGTKGKFYYYPDLAYSSDRILLTTL